MVNLQARFRRYKRCSILVQLHHPLVKQLVKFNNQNRARKPTQSMPATSTVAGYGAGQNRADARCRIGPHWQALHGESNYEKRDAYASTRAISPERARLSPAMILAPLAGTAGTTGERTGGAYLPTSPEASRCRARLVILLLTGGTEALQQFAQGVRGGLCADAGTVRIVGLYARLRGLTLCCLELLANLGQLGA